MSICSLRYHSFIADFAHQITARTAPYTLLKRWTIHETVVYIPFDGDLVHISSSLYINTDHLVCRFDVTDGDQINVERLWCVIASSWFYMAILRAICELSGLIRYSMCGSTMDVGGHSERQGIYCTISNAIARFEHTKLTPSQSKG